ncbi:MAG: hypothetical protein ACPHAS_00545 [Synechococcus sp.]
MSWDPGLLRKYSATGHFRLLNQLRGDLKKKPLDRDPATGLLKMPGSGRGQRSTRRSESFRQESVRTDPNRVDSPRVDTVRHVVADTERVTDHQPPLVELAPLSVEQPTSFRDRLNAIEMR